MTKRILQLEQENEQLKKELELYKTIYQILPTNLKRYLNNIGKLCAAVRRDYKVVYGVLLNVDVEVVACELAVQDKVFNYVTSKWDLEKKISYVDLTNTVQFDFIEEKQQMEEAT